MDILVPEPEPRIRALIFQKYGKLWSLLFLKSATAGFIFRKKNSKMAKKTTKNPKTRVLKDINTISRVA